MKTFTHNLFIVLIPVLLIGYAPSMNGENAAHAIVKGTPQKQNIVGQEVTYSDGTTTMKGYLAYDQALDGRRPGILVVHEWWGHNDYARKRARMLAEMGYVALAVDMYGDGKTAEHPEDAGKFAGMVMQNMETAKARFMSAMDKLKADPHVDPEKIAAIGYCFGGGVVLNMALMGVDLDGVASFHGSLPLPEDVDGDAVKASILVCHGADDPFVPEETVNAFKEMSDQAGLNMKFVAYPGAVHSFTSPAADTLAKKFDMPIAYNENADKQSWQELNDFLAMIFKR